MISNGTTAGATTSDTAVEMFDTEDVLVRRVTIVNEGSVAGFFSIDGGNVWARLPATSSRTIVLQNQMPVICQIKRIASGSNLATVWADAV